MVERAGLFGLEALIEVEKAPQDNALPSNAGERPLKSDRKPSLLMTLDAACTTPGILSTLVSAWKPHFHEVERV